MRLDAPRHSCSRERVSVRNATLDLQYVDRREDAPCTQVHARVHPHASRMYTMVLERELSELYPGTVVVLY
jgi:hypothetical protein